MITIQLKRYSGDTPREFNVLYANIFYESEETVFTDVDWDINKIVHAYYDIWDIPFGKLSLADMDWLETMTYREEPLLSTDGGTVWYGILIKKLDVKVFSGRLICKKKIATIP